MVVSLVLRLEKQTSHSKSSVVQKLLVIFPEKQWVIKENKQPKYLYLAFNRYTHCIRFSASNILSLSENENSETFEHFFSFFFILEIPLNI